MKCKQQDTVATSKHLHSVQYIGPISDDGKFNFKSYIFFNDDMKQNPTQIDHYMNFVIDEIKNQE